MEVTPTLLDLQSLDLSIDRLRARERTLEGGDEVAAVRREADAAESALGELRLAIDVMDRDAAKLEHEIDSLTQKAADEESRLYGGAVANAKELDAIRHEVDNLKKRRSDREDELLVLMEQREGLERRAKEAETVATDLRAKVEIAGETPPKSSARSRASWWPGRDPARASRPRSIRSSSSCTRICAGRRRVWAPQRSSTACARAATRSCRRSSSIT